MENEFAPLSDKKGKGIVFRSKLQEERFQQLVAEVEDYAIVLLEKDGTIVSWNQGAQKLTGYAANEMLGRNFSMFYSREDRDKDLPAQLLRDAADKKRVSYEGWRVRKDGSTFWGSVTVSALHDSAGNLNGFLKLTRDITERKVVEDNYSNHVEDLRLKNEALKQSEERYHKMVSEVRDYAIIMLDREGHIMDWNKGAERIKGYSSSEIIGKSFRLFYSKEDKEARLPDRLLQEAADSGSVTHEGWRIKKDGSRFWGSVLITALHDDHGKIMGFTKVTRDLTDRKIAEDKLANYADELKFKNAELRRSEERYHRMIAEVQDYAIILLDESGIIQNWNAGAEKIKGYRAAEIVGSSFEIFYPPEDRISRLPKRLLEEATTNGRAIHEGWRVRKDGSRFWGNTVITALHGDNGNIIGFSKVTRDLTLRKEADDQIKRNAVELEDKNRSLQRLNEEISSFAYVASHDLKEPLRKIQTFANRILDGGDGDETRHFTEKILTSATRMRQLMDDLLSYSRLSKSESLTKDVDLNEVVKASLNDLELKVAEKHAQINVNHLPVIKGIEFQLHQLFTNLLTNALKFSRPGVTPEIIISSARIRGKDIPLGLVNGTSGYHKITVSDNGMGFNQSDAARIFDVFQRLHQSKEVTGTGIGLAIVKRIMENHGGAVNAMSNPGEGATFHLYFHA
ncbi:PAS domain S-box protein [Chryseolinea sp. T2]|uniref:PAS domain-containing sensor histidine kinase n=1 Tax=Chryseolinea sp. T2 TaxID=3129255 RepID=UPI00307801B4